MGYLIGYLFGGMVFSIFIDLIIRLGDMQIPLSNKERFVMALLWPVFLIIFLVTFVREFFR